MGNEQCSARVLVAEDSFGAWVRSLDRLRLDNVIRHWNEVQAPVVLTKDILSEGPWEPILSFFHKLDTDRNQKVDAFEVLCALICLSGGSVADKIDRLWNIFDFQHQKHLRLAEVELLLQAVSRGIDKASVHATTFDPKEVEAIVCTLYDAYNLTPQEQVSKEQFLRWLDTDIYAQKYVDHIQKHTLMPKGPCTRAEAWRALTEAETLPLHEYPALLLLMGPENPLPKTWPHKKLSLKDFLEVS